MEVDILLRNIYDTAGDVGAMPRRPLQVGKQVGPDEAGVDGAAALLEAQDMIGAQLLLHLDDYLGQGFHRRRGTQVVTEKGGHSQVQQLLHGGGNIVQLRLRRRGKAELFVPQLLRRPHQVHRVVGDALKVPDYFQQLCGLRPVGVADLLKAQFNQVGAQRILAAVAALLLFPDTGCQLRRVPVQGGQPLLQCRRRVPGHICRRVAAALQSDGGGGKEPLIQFNPSLAAAGVGHKPVNQPLQQAGHGEQEQCAQNVKGRVGNSYAEPGDRSIQDGGGKGGLYGPEYRQPHRRTDQIEGQVDQRRPLGVPVGPHRGEHSGNAGADVLPHNNRDRRAPGDLPRDGQRLKDAHRSRAGLDYGSEQRAGQQAQDGAAKQEEELLEGGDAAQPRHRSGHLLHAEHQRGKAQKNDSGVLFLVAFAEHIADDANKRQKRREGGGLEQPDKKIAALNAGQAEKPGRHGGADVGAHNNIDRLLQGHQAGVDKPDYHHRGRRGALDNRRNYNPGYKPGQPACCKPAEKRPEPAPSPALQGLSHQIHAEQKQAQPAQKGQHMKNIHNCSRLSLGVEI